MCLCGRLTIIPQCMHAIHGRDQRCSAGSMTAIKGNRFTIDRDGRVPLDNRADTMPLDWTCDHITNNSNLLSVDDVVSLTGDHSSTVRAVVSNENCSIPWIEHMQRSLRHRSDKGS